MKSLMLMNTGDIVCPLPQHFDVCGDQLLLPDGVVVRHSDSYNATIISHFLVATKPISEDAEILLNFNLAFYDMLKPADGCAHRFDRPVVSGFRYLENEAKQALYVHADEFVRQQALADGFLPLGQDGGIEVRHVRAEPIAFSSTEHKEGDVVFEATGVMLPFPIRTTVEVPGDRHLRLTGGSEFIQHSCLPNVRLQIEGDRIRGVALRHIESHERLTYNYLCTEWEISKVFHCCCNVYCCYGVIKGFRFLDREQQEHLLPHCSPAVREKFCEPLVATASMGAVDTSGSFSISPNGSIFAQQHIKTGTVLVASDAVPRVEKSDFVLGRLRLSHSCDANTVMVDSRLVTSRPLNPGDVITFNLNTWVYRLDAPLACSCGTPRCTKEVQGFCALTEEEKNRFWPLASSEVRDAALAQHHQVLSSSRYAKVQKAPGMGNATFATVRMEAGTRVFHVTGLVLPFPTVYTIYLGEGKHLLFSDGAQCLAHSCNPNTRIVVNPVNGSLDCFATRVIEEGELISFNYLTTEWDMREPFPCACGSAQCFGKIAGFRHLRPEQQLQLWSTATRAVQSLFAQRIRQSASVLATLDSTIVAPNGEAGAGLVTAQDLSSGVVLFASETFTMSPSGDVCFGDLVVAHSCQPSAVFLEGRVVVYEACTAGTPITLNLNQLFYRLPRMLSCQCGSSTCAREIQGFGSLTVGQQESILLCTLPGVRAEAAKHGYRNRSISDLVEVRENGAMGQATFAATAITKGTHFLKVHGLVLPFPTVYTIQLDEQRHLQFGGGAQCLAHSCDPNVRIMIDTEGRTLYCLAIRDIAQGEVISFNYNTTEWDMSTPFHCVCGAPSCTGKIAGFKYLADSQRQRLWWMATPAVRRLAATTENWSRLSCAMLRTDLEGHVRAAAVLTEGTVVLSATQRCLRESGGALVADGVELRHCCRPNAAVVDYHIVLTETVCAGVEITVDLNCLAYNLAAPFQCHCGAESGPHLVSGFASLSSEMKAARLIFADGAVRAAALQDGYEVPCSCSLVSVRANGEMGQATFAAANIRAGTRFLSVKGLCLRFPTVYTIMLEENRHLLFADGAQCLAHSCNPNVRVCVDAVNNTLDVESLRDIGEGELIAFNYNTTEWDMNTPFRCLCGAAECVYEVRGFKHLTSAQRVHLQPLSTPAIKAVASSYADVQLPLAVAQVPTSGGALCATGAFGKGAIIMEVFYLDVQPSHIFLGRNYMLPHDAVNYNCVLVEGRVIASRNIAAGEALSINMNFFVYDMMTLYPRGFVDSCKGFKYMDEAMKQRYLYLCEPPVRAQAMRDGWIVKSSQERLVVRPNGEMGQTAYATVDIAKGTQLFHCDGLVVPFPTMYTICVGSHQHLLFGDAAECIAHHCDPNVAVRVNPGQGTFDFVTVKDIAQGEMVTFNYNTTEWHMNTPFVCLCGSDKCAGNIQGFKHLLDADRQRLWPITSAVVKNLVNESKRTLP